jgi:GTPase SAR1 family protein
MKSEQLPKPEDSKRGYFITMSGKLETANRVLIKIIVLGTASVGKTSIMTR